MWAGGGGRGTTMKTIGHFPPRGSRAASLRGFLQISSPGFKCLSNVANRGQMATPTNSTAEISLEREGERGEDKTEGGRERGRTGGGWLSGATRNSVKKKCPSQFFHQLILRQGVWKKSAALLTQMKKKNFSVFL